MSATRIPRCSGTASPQQVLSALHCAGVCIVEDLVPPTQLDEVTWQMQAFIARTGAGHNDFTGTRTRRTGGLVARSARARDLLCHPVVLAVVRNALAPEEGAQLSNTEIISIGPGETLQPLHRDQEVWPFRFPAGYQPEVSVMWPLNADFTEQNGATRVVPGSHAEPDREDYPAEQVLPATMRRGSVLIWYGSTLHGGGANESGLDRQGLNAAYSVAWLRQEENQFLTTPSRLARNFDDDLLALLGYSRPVPGLGNAVDRSDPLTFLHGIDTGWEIETSLSATASADR